MAENTMSIPRPGAVTSPRVPDVPSFCVITASQVAEVLAGREKEIVDVVADAYLLHDDDLTVIPPSSFLTFADRTRNRIIALPASVGGPAAVDGIKWVASVPGNPARGLPRASAVIVLNDPATGFAYACSEGAIISAARTAASAALAASRICENRLRRGVPLPRTLGVVGAGPIARETVRFLHATGWSFDTIEIADLHAERARALAAEVATSTPGCEVRVRTGSADVVAAAGLVVIATVASEPWLHDAGLLDHRPVLLHVSLRDVAAEVVLAADNVVDDVDHCLRAGTSVHRAELLSGNRDFVTGTLADVMRERVELATDRPVVFSPFGLGLLDVVLARHVHRTLAAAGRLTEVPDFAGVAPGGTR